MLAKLSVSFIAVVLLSMSTAKAGEHYVSLADIFTPGKFAAVSPNFELTAAPGDAVL